MNAGDGVITVTDGGGCSGLTVRVTLGGTNGSGTLLVDDVALGHWEVEG